MKNFEQFLDNFWLHEQNYEYNVINVDNFLIPLTLPPPPPCKIMDNFWVSEHEKKLNIL